MKKKSKRREKKKSMFDLDEKDIKEYLGYLPEAIFLFFMLWFGYSINANEKNNLVYQKYLKKSLIQARKYIDGYFPGFLSSEAVFSKFDYDILFVKTKEIIAILGYMFMAGAILLLIFTSRWRKTILFLSLLLDLGLIHNLIYYRDPDGKLFEIIKIVVYFIILICL